MLEEMIKNYLDAKKVAEEAKARQDELGDKIKELLKNEPDGKFTGNGVQAQLVESIRYTYNDKLAVMNYLKSTGMSNFIVEQLDEKALNAEMRKSDTLERELTIRSVKKSITESLKASEVK